jgi:hypothetical protein
MRLHPGAAAERYGTQIPLEVSVHAPMKSDTALAASECFSWMTA